MGKLTDINHSLLPVWLLLVLLPALIALMALRPQLDLVSLGLLAGATVLVLWSQQISRIRVARIEKAFCYLVFITGFFGVALLPIDIGPFTLFPFRLFLVVLWVLFVMRALLQGKIVLPIQKVKPYMVFLGIWVIYAAISLGWSASKGDAIRHLIFLFIGTSVILFATFYFRDMRDLGRLYWIWFVVFCSMILLGFWEHLTGLHLPISTFYGETRARFMFWPTGVFHNPNDYATYLALSIPFGLGALRYVKNKLMRLFGLGTAILAFYLIVMTSSRANLLAVLLEVTFLLVLLTNLNQKVKVAVAAIACLMVALFAFAGPVQKFALEVSESLGSIATQAQRGTGSVAVRMNLVRNSLLFLYWTAGCGVGAGNAEFWMANFARYDTAGTLNPHNWWVEILTDYGLFIFVGYLLFYGGLLHSLWRSWRRLTDRSARMIAEALLVALVGFAIGSISSSSIMALHPHWLLFAFALVFLNWWRCFQAKEVV